MCENKEDATEFWNWYRYFVSLKKKNPRYLYHFLVNYYYMYVLVIRGISEVDCIESLMIAYESKIKIFEEMRYFLMFYLNLGFIVRQALLLLIWSNFSFLSIGHSFSRTFILLKLWNFSQRLHYMFFWTLFAIIFCHWFVKDCIWSLYELQTK